MTIDSSVHKLDSPGRFEVLAGGGLLSIILFSVGILFLAVPVVGLLLGPLMMVSAVFVALFHVGLLFRHKHGYEGHCPSCGATVLAGEPGSVGQCTECKSAFVHHDNHLWKVER